ncbi:MAG: endonuclease/exonuclease/phosphatase family protein [Acidimicrobiales bacterium]
MVGEGRGLSLDTTVRLVTFNIQHGRGPWGRVDVVELGRECARLAPDVLGLQEVDAGMARSHRADLAAEAGRAAGMAVAFGPACSFPDGGRYGNALLVRGSLEDVEVTGLPRRSRGEARAAVVAVAVVGGHRMSVAVCHLGVDPREATEQLAAVLDLLAARPAPRALLGDLNLAPCRVAPLVGEAGLGLAGGPPTFPSLFPVRRIDHVAGAGLTFTATAAPRSSVSDHRPLVVEAAPCEGEG